MALKKTKGMREKPSQTKTKEETSEAWPSAAGAGLSIGIIGWNSPKFSQSHGAFIDALKKSVVHQGHAPVFFGLCSGSDLTYSHANGKSGLPGESAGHRNAAQNYSLPSRDIVADQIEILVQEEHLSGLVMVPWSINSLVGMLMATIRCGVPTIFLPHYAAWPMFSEAKNPSEKGRDSNPLAYSRCSMLALLEVFGLTRIGALDAMFTEKSAKFPKAEKIQKSVLQSEAAPETGDAFAEIVEWGGRRIVDLAKQKISTRRFFSPAAFHNVMCIDMALGSAPETILHLNALAYEAGSPLSLAFFNETSKKVPQMVPMDKAGEFNVRELEKNGGILALLGALHGYLQPSPTVVGKNIIEIAKENSHARSAFFKLNHPNKKYGGLSVLFGNIAREGALFRVAGLKEQWLMYSGPAKVFDTEEHCLDALRTKKIKKGDVIVLRYCGPKGSPGMPYLSGIGEAVENAGLEESVALITDGRAILPGRMPAFVHVAPEAAIGSSLAVLQDGDIIFWSYADRVLSVRLTDTEIKVRLSRWKEQERNMKNSFLYRYSKYSSSSALGATLV